MEITKWLKTIAARTLQSAVPASAFIQVAVDSVSDKVASYVKDEASAQAYKFLVRAHRRMLSTILWQNGLLVLSLFPVYLLHSAYPFYAAYVVVAGYSTYTTIEMWPFFKRMLTLRSLKASIAAELLSEIKSTLETKDFLQRKAIDLLSVDLEKVSDSVASEIKHDVMAAAISMALMLTMAFIAFRLFAIPWLEHKIIAC